jgi:hypothetical protein
MKGPALTEAKNSEEESTMISKTFRIARMIVLASFALSSCGLSGDLSKRLFEWHLRVAARRHS